MNQTLTIAIVTSRPEPKLEWLYDSISREADTVGVHLIVISPHVQEAKFIPTLHRGFSGFAKVTFSHPKPTVWSGPCRVMKEDWWSAANARNTALCLCETDWVMFCDDRAVLKPHWLTCVMAAMQNKYGLAGAYEKRHGLAVEHGAIISEGTVSGADTREAYVRQHWDNRAPVDCPSNWWFGCLTAIPLEWALTVNGYDETCDGLSMEDVIFGMHLTNARFKWKYDHRFKVIQDRTPGQLGVRIRREDKGVSPNDKSHALLARLQGLSSASHPINLRAIRNTKLAGGPWPAPWGPTHDWYDGQPIAEFA